MSDVIDTAASRCEALRRFDPLLDRWVRDGVLADGEADLALLAAEATEQRAPLRLVVPGGSSQLATAVALHIAVRTLSQPGRYPPGAVVLVGGAAERAAAAAMDVDGALIARSLSAVRLRGDGLGQLVPTSRVVTVGAEHRLMFVSPRSGWPSLDVPVAVAVLDRRSLGSGYDDAHAWAVRTAAVVQVVAELDPQMTPSSYEVDWPLIAVSPHRWGRASAWPVAGDVALDVAAADPTGLGEARTRIAAAADTNREWPRHLSAAASLSRALASVAVPLGTYDTHTVGTIAASFAERAADLAEIGPGDLPEGWRSFAETDWATIKRRLLDAAAELDAHNPKAELVGLTVEAVLADGGRITIWTDTAVHARALQTHLVTAGFGVTPEDFEADRIRVRPLAEAHLAGGDPRTSVLTALPASWHLPAVIAGGVGGPLRVLSYPFEADRAARYFGWALNAGRLERHAQRVSVSSRALGEGLSADSPPPPVALRVSRHDTHDQLDAGAAERGEDAAELAALAADEWLALHIQEREHHATDHTPVAAIAYLVEPGPSVLLVAAHALVDRLVAGRLRSVPAATLAPGMRILTAQASGGVFAALRPHLDQLHGLGTRFWLDQWDDALNAALAAAGSAVELTARLTASGSSISAAAVASWPSPYRIGPRDAENVARVATLAGRSFVAHHHRRVHAVMRGVRIEHGRIGRQLAAAMRHHLDGDPDAFASVEERLGVDIGTLIDDPTIYTVRERLAAGTAPASSLGRVHRVAASQQLFVPQEPT